MSDVSILAGDTSNPRPRITLFRLWDGHEPDGRWSWRIWYRNKCMIRWVGYVSEKPLHEIVALALECVNWDFKDAASASHD